MYCNLLSCVDSLLGDEEKHLVETMTSFSCVVEFDHYGGDFDTTCGMLEATKSRLVGMESRFYFIYLLFPNVVNTL